ncbi:E3 SUMO-protein ligase ZNF451 isoform X2 [Pseudophryne corroboree]|uniref:E3 SUMO-protein ligase ZNF451 isoform X2 n=1 Tax=Pseudophryne corroboree TaxID=495146 RepID=UPI003081CB8A
MDSDESSEEIEMQMKEDDCDEKDIEFISEGHLRPVLECIDLVSSDDDSPVLNRKPKDHIDRQKERVASTLERLARHVEVEKQMKAEKNKAFQEKLNFQHAHGLQELEFTKDLPGANAAKVCVNQWLKMPGLKPGNVSASRRNVTSCREHVTMNSQPITCPVMHCKRKFDNGQLLLGHLKRFDHSPCDPTIFLHGACKTSYACHLCCLRFASITEYNNHLSAKAELADGHERNLPPLVIQCFACPSCFLLFYQRDECLKHMSASNHFVHTIVFKDTKGVPCPIPIPSFAKKVLIALCKDIPFQIVCTSCRRELRSHVELTAHFRTRCRKAGPTSFSEKSVADVAAVFRLKAYCLPCKQALVSDASIAKHIEKTNHKVKVISSIEQSIQAFCYINEGNKTPSDYCFLATNARLKPCMLKRTLSDCNDPRDTLKCKTRNENINGCPAIKRNSNAVTAWFCECHQQFSTEHAAGKHIMIANRISHKCLVCGKLAEDLGIIHLHMSRFHGGAHLNNFRFWCQICSIELTRIEQVMAHVSDCHGGHSFYYEQEVLEELSTSSQTQYPREIPDKETPSSSSSSQQCEGMWQCHICEEMFDLEDSVQKHCKSLNIHQFHKYCCDTCNKRFHKLETLLRHCQLQHDGTIKVKYFCGLCEDLHFDQENDFLAHYESFHSLDYGFVPNQSQSPSKSPEVSSTTVIGNENSLTCGCLVNYPNKAQRKESNSLCLVKLFATGKLWYSCCLCSATDQTREGLSSHCCKQSQESSSKNFVVKCSICSKSFTCASGAQSHYHTLHCFLEKPCINNLFGTCGTSNEVFQFTASGSCVNKKPGDAVHTKRPHFEAQGRSLAVSTGKCASPSAQCKTDVKTLDPQHADIGTPKVSTTKSVPPNIKPEVEAVEIQPMDTGLEETELPDLEFLLTMTHIVFVDLDNWPQFFTRLPGHLNQGIFIWGFQGGKNIWKPPINCKIFMHLSYTGCFFLHPRCCDRKDAADFAICMHAGRLDEQLPKQIPFSILSGDKGFLELQNQFKKTQRPAHILNPHHLDGEMMCALLNSISETAQEKDDADIEMNSVEQDEEANMEEAIRRSLVEM